MDDAKDVVVINHGRVFPQWPNWYTFYCPSCNYQIEGKQPVCKCGQSLIWKENKND